MRKGTFCLLALLAALAACTGDICSQTAGLYSQYASAIQACENQQLQGLGLPPASPVLCTYDTSSCESGLGYCSAQDIQVMEANLQCANEQVAQFRSDCGSEVIGGCADGGTVSTACSLAIQQVQVNCGDGGF